MPHNHHNLTAKMLNEPKNPFHIKDRKRGRKKIFRSPHEIDRSANLVMFMEMLESLGGKFEPIHIKKR
jgi:hypothetical protein